MSQRKGQSILEYIIIIVALVGAIMAVANGVFKDKITESYNHLTGEMADGIQKIQVD